MKTIKAGSGEWGETGEEGKAHLLDGWTAGIGMETHTLRSQESGTPQGWRCGGWGDQSPMSRAEEHGVSPEMGAGTSPAVRGALMRSLGFTGGRGEDTRVL